MKITKENNRITINNPQDFNIIQTLNCGQIFRYVIDGNTAQVFSKDKMAYVKFDENKIEILTEDVEYFYHFFDLDRDYSQIKNTLKKDEFLLPAVNFGWGIRILNNDVYEMIISFIISANNHISRIKRSIEYLSENFGSKILCAEHLKNLTGVKEYYAFPTLNQLKNVTVEQYRQAGLGYRAEQMFDTVQKLTDANINNLLLLDFQSQFRFLTSLKGIGEKVANCIMLFGLGVKNVFPVDTWINKVYNNLMHTNETDRKKICAELTKRYGNLSGYAQQYVFYYYRDNNLK